MLLLVGECWQDCVSLMEEKAQSSGEALFLYTTYKNKNVCSVSNYGRGS
jgi:hypothetical protein